MLLPALPLNANGKVDRLQLPRPEFGPQKTTTYMAPRTVTEEIVAGIWADVLKLGNIGCQDHFFERGGDSLLAMSMVARLRRAFQVDVPVSLLFDHPVLANLSERIDELRVGGSMTARPPVVPVPHNRPLPLSFYQERVWRYCQAASDPLQFRTQINIELRGPLNLAAFKRAFTELYRRHEALRTTYETSDGEPVQIIGPSPSATLHVIDLEGQADVEALVDRHVADDARSPFDLTRGPLLRAMLLRYDRERHQLVLSVHHLIYDASVREVLYFELGVLYGAYRRGEPSPLPNLVLQYGDFAVWQRSRLRADGELFQRQLAFWQKQLMDVPVLKLPFERSSPAPLDLSEARHRIPWLPKDLICRLDALSHKEGATIFVIVLAAFKALLHRCTGQKDIVVGTYVVDRTQPELEGIVGLKTNQLPLRTRFSGDSTFQELLHRVRETTSSAYARQDIPFGNLIEALQSIGQQPAPIEANVQFVRMSRTQLALSDLEIEFLVPVMKTKPWGVSLTLVRTHEGRIRGAVTFDIERYDAARVRAFTSAYINLLEQVTVCPELRLSDVPDPFQDERSLNLTGCPTGLTSRKAIEVRDPVEDGVARI
jgi:hypothetical protein